MKGRDVAGVLIVLGAALIVAGVALWSIPAGLLVAGVLLLMAGVDMTTPTRRARPDPERDTP